MKRVLLATGLFAGVLFGNWQAVIDPSVAGGSFVHPAAAYNDDAYRDFDQALRPYGHWVVTRQWGHVWIPAGMPRGWRPYSDGHWDYTDDYGWVWVSDQEWGWAPFHYGRWAFDRHYGWVWVPGRVWGPAWVSFRYGDAYIGWAPLPPEGDDYDYVPRYGYEPTIAISWWNFVPRQRFNDRQINRYVVYNRNTNIYHVTKNVTNITVVNNRVVNNSIDVHEFERATNQQVVRHRVAVVDSVVPVDQRARGDDIVLVRPKEVEQKAGTPWVQRDKNRGNANQPDAGTAAGQGKPTGGQPQTTAPTIVPPPTGKPDKGRGNVNQPDAGTAAGQGKPAGGQPQTTAPTIVPPPTGKPDKGRGNINQPDAGTAAGQGKPAGGQPQTTPPADVLPPPNKPDGNRGNANQPGAGAGQGKPAGGNVNDSGNAGGRSGQPPVIPPPDNAKPQKTQDNNCKQADGKDRPKP